MAICSKWNPTPWVPYMQASLASFSASTEQGVGEAFGITISNATAYVLNVQPKYVSKALNRL